MRAVRACIAVAVLSAFLIAVVLPTQAQEPANLEQGLKPFGSYQGGNIDTVSLTNGNLMLHIPLLSYPQRGGKLSLGFVLKYNNKGWQDQVVKNQQGQNVNIWVWEGAGVEVARDQFVENNDTGMKFTEENGDQIIVHLYNAVTADGSSHELEEQQSGGSTYESVDTTGIQRFSTAQGVVLVDRNGLRHLWETTALSQIEDPNGNLITYNSSSGWTDTLGRVIPGVWGSYKATHPSLGSVSPGVATTNLSSCPSGSSFARTWTVPAPTSGGGTSSFTFCYENVTVTSQFTAPGITNESAPDVFLNAVVLPDGTSWQFTYNSWGDLTQVTFPTGGSLTYAWTTGASCQVSTPDRAVASRDLNANDGTSGTWKYRWQVSIGSSLANIVTDPLGNDSVHYPTSVAVPCTLYDGEDQYYQGAYTANNLLKTTTTQYTGINNPREEYEPFSSGINVVPTTITTTWANGKTVQETKLFDSTYTFYFYDYYRDLGTNYPLIYRSLLNETMSDYGANGSPGPVLRKTTTQYQWMNDSTYQGANLLNLPASVQVFEDGGSTQAAFTQFTYGDSIQSSGVTKQHNSTPSAAHRGNLLTLGHWLNGSTTSTTNCGTSVSNGNLNSTSVFYDTGTVYEATDPCGHTTTYAYSSTYYGAYNTQTTLPSTSSPNPTSHSVSGTYDFNTGLLASYTDENSNQSTYSYDDMWRFTTAVLPPLNGTNGQVNFYYPNPTTVERKEQLDSTRMTDLYVAFDGVGREIRRITANGEATPWDQVDTCYNARGQKSFVSYPYQGTGLSMAEVCSGAGDAYLYDPLGRVTLVTHSDASTVTTSYTGAATSVTDEGNGTRPIQKITQVDGLGRLISVCEATSVTLSFGLGSDKTPSACGQDISATGFLTSYSYAFSSSTSNQTFTVQQGLLNPRVSSTDSVGWLVSAADPESGTTTYGYDADGNVISRVAPAPNQTGSSTVTATITYDPLHRLRTKSYSDGTTPTVTINYDEGSAFGRTLTDTNGRQSSAFTPSGASQAAEVFSYDSMGHIIDNSQCTPQNCSTSGIFPMTYSYDLLGDELTGTNGLGTTLTYAYNVAPRMTTVTSSLSDSNHPPTLLSAVHYNAFGGDTSASLGNGITDSLAYTARGWWQSLTTKLSSTTVYSFSLGFAGNGDVTSGNDSVNGNWTYTFDDFNRLLTASSTASSLSFAYDRYGNRYQQNVTGGTGTKSSLAFNANNQVIPADNVSYDAAGNVTNDGTHKYTYDGENRIICVDGPATASCLTSGSVDTYVYDAEGNRVRKTASSVSVDYLYDLSSHVITELSSSGAWNRTEVFAGGHHVATYASGTTYFIHADWLGTERSRTNVSGAVVETCTNAPFGDNQSCTGTDVSPLHFTGKQRDTETNLDDFGARYFNSGMARWVTPDWSARPEGVPYATLGNPQTLNLYAYVGNNPVTRVDSDGHDPCRDEGGTNCGEGGVAAIGNGGEMINTNEIDYHQEESEDQTAKNAEQQQNPPPAQNQQSAGQGQGTAQQQNGDVAAAKHYLSGSKEMRLVLAAFKSGHYHLVIIHDGNDRYDPQTRTVYWDPRSALRTTEGGHQTPALGLGHEMAHATGNRHDTAVLSNTPDRRYDNKEEGRVIRNYESPAARELGESARSNHGGTPYNVNCPTCQ